MAETLITCGPLRIDLSNQRLWRNDEEVRLTPKAFAVLRVLLARAGQMVTKAELLRTAWEGTIVTEAALTVCIRELRRALGDEARKPQYIETVHRRGFRFIAAVSAVTVSRSTSLVSSENESEVSAHVSNLDESLGIRNQKRETLLVGRDTELTHLYSLLEKAMAGERQLVFVTGEPGIGKTALLDAFLRRMWNGEGGTRAISSSSLKPKVQIFDPAPWLAHGQCIEHFGPGEAYMPLLSALGTLGRGPERQRLQTVLRQYAPTWLMQLPSLLTPEEMAVLQPQTFGATRERMLRELAEALEALTAETVLVLVLEDLHWSDPSTLDAVSFLARRRHLAKLLVLGSYRPMEVLGNGHPLRVITEDLQVHRHSVELPVPLLTEAAVAEYLSMRAALPTLAPAIHQRTGGNPLFMVNVVEDLLTHPPTPDQQVSLPLSVPASIRQMIERHYDHLTPEEQRILQRASVVGMTFSAAAIGSDEHATLVDVEAYCASLARREQFLRARSTSEWPDGTQAGQFSFRHALYQEVIYDRVTPSAQQQFHRQIGERLERAYGEHANTIAAELAVHFELARDYPRAVLYHGVAGQSALRRNAPQEARGHLTTALDLLSHFPASVERNQQELPLQMALGVALMNAKGYTVSEVERAYSRAQTLCEELGDSPQIFPILVGLVVYHAVRGEFLVALSLSERSLTLAQRLQDPSLLLEAHRSMGYILFHTGNHNAARSHIEQALKLYDPQQHTSHAFLYGHEPGAFCLCYLASISWYLGYPDQATKRVHEALAFARQLAHSLTLLGTLHVGTTLAIFAQDLKAALPLQYEEVTIARQYDVPFYEMVIRVHEGWALSQQGKASEAIPQIRQALDTISGAGFVMMKPTFLSFLSEAYSKAGDVVMALTTITEALATVEQIGERTHEAELYRLKGELTLQSQISLRQVKTGQDKSEDVNLRAEAEAEACFLKAIAIAREQSAKSWELRATMSLVRLRQQQIMESESRTSSRESRQKLAEAHLMLSDVYNWFTEGFDTPDLQDAKALLEVLSS